MSSILLGGIIISFVSASVVESVNYPRLTRYKRALNLYRDKNRRRELKREEKIHSDHMQNGNVPVVGIGTLES